MGAQNHPHHPPAICIAHDIAWLLPDFTNPAQQIYTFFKDTYKYFDSQWNTFDFCQRIIEIHLSLPKLPPQSFVHRAAEHDHGTKP